MSRASTQRARPHRGVLAGSDRGQLGHCGRATHLGRSREAGRRRCISRARRRRSSTCSRAAGSRSSGTASRRRRSPSGRGTASSTSLSSTRTRSARATTVSSCSPSDSATTPANTLLPRAGVSWLGPTWVLQGAPEDHPWAREAAVGPPTWEALAERPSRIVNVDDVPRTASGDGRRGRWRAWFEGSETQPDRSGRPLPLRRAAGDADEPAARALRRGGDLRRSRGQRDRSCSTRARATAARSRSSRCGAGCTIARPAGIAARPRDPRRRRRDDGARLRNVRPERHRATTRGRARSASAASG